MPPGPNLDGTHLPQGTTFWAVPRILIAADAPWIVDDVTAAVSGPDTEVVPLDNGAAVLPWLAADDCDLVILDMQVGNMGGVAVCQEMRLEEEAGRMYRVPALILLDRRADVFLARRVDAEGWLVKPLDPIRLRRAIAALLDGGTYYDGSFAPSPILVAGSHTRAPEPDQGPAVATRGSAAQEPSLRP